MADTKNAIRLNNTWVNLNSVLEIPVGTTLVIQNQTSSAVNIVVSASTPDDNFRGMLIPADLAYPATVVPDTSSVWVKGQGPISVQSVE